MKIWFFILVLVLILILYSSFRVYFHGLCMNFADLWWCNISLSHLIFCIATKTYPNVKQLKKPPTLYWRKLVTLTPFFKSKLCQGEMDVTDERGPVDQSDALLCAQFIWGFGRILNGSEWCRWLILSSLRMESLTPASQVGGFSHPHCSWQLLGEGSPCLCRVSPDPGCCSPDKTGKQPPSLLPAAPF